MSQQAHWRSESRLRVSASALPRQWPWSIVLAFGVALAGTVAVALLQGEKPFFNDSGGYWGLGAAFTVNGHFSLLNFSDPWKGYVLPLIDHGLQGLATDLLWTSSSIVKLFNAFLFALIGAVLAPAFSRTIWPRQPSWGFGRRLALTAILIVFWSGFLNFPLSDFPGLAAVLLALVALARIDSPGWMFVAGAALSVSINIRTAYLPLLPFTAVLVAWAWWDQRGTRHASTMHRVLCATLLVLGFAAASLPQSLSGHRYHHTWSFIPGASVPEPEIVYYNGGIGVQGYDTYVENGQAAVAMSYEYPAGRHLLEAQKEGKITSASQYAGLFVSHPTVMGGLLVSHVVNGLDPLYSTPYVENLHNAGRTWGRIAGFLLIFLTLLRLLWPAARRLMGPSRLRFLAALALCTLTTLISEMERRYMLPVYMISYVVALTPGWPNPIPSGVSGMRRFQTAGAIAIGFLVFTASVWYITDNAISHLRLS